MVGTGQLGLDGGTGQLGLDGWNWTVGDGWLELDLGVNAGRQMTECA